MDLLIFNKAAAFCAYQERTHGEVRERLRKWGVYGSDAEEIIAGLITQNYLSEERFARTYAGGKFRVRQWGRLKIKMELKRRGLSEYNIGEGIKEIGDSDYKEGLMSLLKKKSRSLPGKDSRELEAKLVRFALGKGYEMDLVRESVREILSGDVPGAEPEDGF